MKALILAGGAGTRLRPITHTRAKQLVPVANTPILHYGIRSMVDAGITELGVIVGDTRDEVTAGLGDGSQFGASITYIPQDEPLGLAHCVLIAREFLGDDDFVMYLGDNMLEQDLSAFVDACAQVINSTIRGPVAIGANAVVVDSFIGPFSAIGAGCEIRHSEVEHSVIMENSRIIDIPRLEDSLIGSDAVVSRTKRKPRAVRLMVGDHCQIDVE